MEQAAEEVVEADTMRTFKEHLDRHVDWKGLAVYGLNVGIWD